MAVAGLSVPSLFRLAEEGSTVIVRFGSFGSTLFGKGKEGLPEGGV